MKFPISPTGTLGIQKAFTVAIRKSFRDGFREINQYIESNKWRMQESLISKQALDNDNIEYIINILGKVSFKLSPIVTSFISMAWFKANKDVGKVLKLGEWVPYDKRIFDAVKSTTYGYVEKLIADRQAELREILTTGMSQGDTINTIANDIKKAFKVTSWKSELIARSEVIKTHGKSTRMAIIQGGVTKEYKWLTSLRENVCPICRPLHERIFQVNSRDSPMPVTSTHPNCNCGIVPHVRIGEVE